MINQADNSAEPILLNEPEPNPILIRTMQYFIAECGFFTIFYKKICQKYRKKF